jgi:signal transduction histidine kinase
MMEVVLEGNGSPHKLLLPFDVPSVTYRDVRVALEAVGARVRAALGSEASVAVARPDAAGRLRVVWHDDGWWSTLDRSAHRRDVFDLRRPILVRLEGDRALATVPLATGSTVLGTLEIEADEGGLVSAWGAIQVMGGQLAMTMENVAERDRLHREAETLEGASLLGSRLVHAPTIEEAVDMVVRFLADRFRVPVAGWSPGQDLTLRLSAIAGLRGKAWADLGAEMGELRHHASGIAGRDALAKRFAAVAGTPGARAFHAAGSLVVAGTRGGSHEASLEAVASLLVGMLRLVAAATTASARRQQLDMGLAWTAHELRAPLTGLRAALEALGHRRDPDSSEGVMMQSAVRELDQLMGTTEALLQWATGARPLQRRPEDLVLILREAVESCRLETGVTALVTDAPRRAVVRVAREHVRTAIANLLRNAAAHADAGTRIEASVRHEADRLTVSVTDVGPQIPAEERSTIFEPFVRGRGSSRTRTGSGLGLFIARRVVEAHGGTIGVDSTARRTTFRIRFPIEQTGVQRFAS